MQTIVVRYLETVTDSGGAVAETVLGTETYDDIKEALIPGVPQAKLGRAPHPVFITKCFVGVSNHLWRLESVSTAQANAQQPAIFSVLIKRHDVSKEIFFTRP